MSARPGEVSKVRASSDMRLWKFMGRPLGTSMSKRRATDGPQAATGGRRAGCTETGQGAPKRGSAGLERCTAMVAGPRM